MACGMEASTRYLLDTNDPTPGHTVNGSVASTHSPLSPGLRLTVRNTFLTVEGEVPDGERSPEAGRCLTAPATMVSRASNRELFRSQGQPSAGADVDDDTGVSDCSETSPRQATEIHSILLQIPLTLSLFQGSALAKQVDDVSVLVMQTGNEADQGAPFVDLRLTFGQGAFSPGKESPGASQERITAEDEKVCRHWKNKGWCRFQNTCKFLHTPSKRGEGLLQSLQTQMAKPPQGAYSLPLSSLVGGNPPQAAGPGPWSMPVSPLR
mmetsp:Transcript_11216/g.20462  ORF Transcript_11216/g.20462 Transcript_11216/m.20462 type:complete len:266 (+) Transcript_11216:53-850(+)